MAFAKVSLLGRVGKDPEVMYFESGKVKASLSVCVEDYNKNAQWFNCEAWGKTGELIANYVHKGHLVLFDGDLKTQEWEDKQTGQKRTKIYINVNQVHLMPNKQDSQQNQNQVTSESTRANPQSNPKPVLEQTPTVTTNPESTQEDLEDIPF